MDEVLACRKVGQSVFRYTVFDTSDVSSLQPVLMFGSIGAEVKLVQQFLFQTGFYKYALDGVFGAKMFKAVVAYQLAKHRKPTGLIRKFSEATFIQALMSTGLRDE